MSYRNAPARRSTFAALGIGLLTAVSIGLSYWVVTALIRPDEPMSLRILYRYDDTDYLPFIYALSRLQLHEFVNAAGGGLLPFPLLMDVPHAAMVALFGDWGFAAADAAIMVVWFVLFFLLAKVFVRESRAAVLVGLTMLVVAGPWNWPKLSPFEFWGFRYTRPFIGGLFMLSLVLTTRTIAGSFLEGRAKPAFYVVQGLLLGGSAQGDMHLAMIGCFVTATMYGLAFAAPRSRSLGLKATLLTTIGFAFAVIPLVIQQVVGHSTDYTARLGMFPVDRLHPPFYFDADNAIGLASVLGLWALAFILASRYAARQVRDINLLLGTIVAFLIFSILALTLSTVILGHGFLLYEFQDRREKFTHLGLIVGSAIILVLAYRAWQSTRWAARWRTPSMMLVIGGIVLIGVSAEGIRKSFGMAEWRALMASQPRVIDSGLNPKLIGWWHFGWPIMPNYRSDFAALARELGRPQYDEDRVLGTFDQQLGVWWLAFRRGYLFVPDPFVSTAPDNFIQRRTLELLRLAGGTSQFLNRRLNESYFVERYLSHGAWQASKAYTYRGLDDYNRTQAEYIQRTTVLHSWSVIVPRSERQRLLAEFDRLAEPTNPPALIILPKGAGYETLPGPAAPYRLAYENGTFRVWRLATEPQRGP